MSAQSDEERRVTEWREMRLIAAGVPPDTAAWVARTPGFDVHAVLDLLDRGCPVDLAIRISRPIDPQSDT